MTNYKIAHTVKIAQRQWQGVTPDGTRSQVFSTKKAAWNWVLNHTCSNWVSSTSEGGYADVCLNCGGHCSLHEGVEL